MPDMKLHRRRKLLIAITLGCCLLLVGAVLRIDRHPSIHVLSFSQVEASCATTLRTSPRIEALETWLKANKISYARKEAPYDKPPYDEWFKDMLFSHGLSRSDVERSSSCITFGSLHVSGGGFLANRVASGFFIFSSDGALIDYHLDSICYSF